MRISESSKIGENVSGVKKNSKLKNVANAASTKVKNSAKNKFNNTSIGQKLNQFRQKKNGLSPEKEGQSSSDGSDKKDSSAGKNGTNSANEVKNEATNEAKDEATNEAKDEAKDEAKEELKDEVKENTVGKLKSKVKSILLKVGAYVLVGFFFICVILLIVSIIIAPFAWLFGDDDSSDSNSDVEESRIKYEKKLSEVINEYEEKCNISIDVSYIHATLVYKYNLDMEKFSEDINDIDDSDIESNVSGDDSDREEQYDDMIDNIDDVVEAWVGNSCQIDYAIGGYSYNNLINSSFIKDYFEDFIDNGEKIEDIVKMIFELGEAGSEYIQDEYDNFLSEDIVININGRKINIKDYIGGQVYLYFNSSMLNDSESIKSAAVIYSTNLVISSAFDKNKLSINVEESSYCDLNLGCSYSNNVLKSGPGLQEDGNDVFYNNEYYYKKPADSSTKSKIMDAINSVFGDILLDDMGNVKKVTNESTSDIKWVQGGTTSGNTYKEILNETYGSSKVENIKEDNYTSNVDYGNNTVLTKAIFYDQTDYKNVEFCGRKGKSISSSGCGVTAMAIIASTYKNDKNFDPIYMMQSAYQGKYCGQGISGTNTGFYKYEAKKLGFTYQSVGKKKKEDLNTVLKNLENGNLVIAHMGAGTFTNGGHYIVLGGINKDSKEVYVYDPYNAVNKNRKKSGNGWYSFNDVIVKEVHSFYIIGKGN